jgi:peroxiredoxin Q/BCP
MGIRDRLKSALGLGARTHLTVGVAAPAIDLPDASGRLWTLGELRGHPAVLYFYPKDDTPGCTKQACGFRDDYPTFERSGARLLGVSTDGAGAHNAFARKFNLPFPLLVDAGGAMSERWGVTGSMGSRRVTFLLDRDGRIAQIWEPVSVDGHAAEVRAALAKLG